MKAGWFLATGTIAPFSVSFLLHVRSFALLLSNNLKNKECAIEVYKTIYLLTLYSTFNVVVLKKDIKKHVVEDQQT